MLDERRIDSLLTTAHIGRRISQAEQVGSTMAEARRLAETGAVAGTVCLAETQSAGRGRAGRAWLSPPAVNLYPTFVLYPPAESPRALAYVAPLAVALALEEAAAARGVAVRADLKWPNDVRIGDRKVAGVLIETATLNDRLTAFVGIGVNVNLTLAPDSELAAIATSLQEATGVAYEREAVLAALCNHLEALYEQSLAGSRAPFERWRERLVTLGQDVTVSGPGLQLDGRAVAVDEDGALIVETSAGRRTRVEAGDVTLRRN
jgi:BirA family biotin operon repressor/biotin-[acetyl-CoA-carboxylase] ligase